MTINLDWLLGFVEGEGCFSIYAEKPTTKRPELSRTYLHFILNQDEESLLLKIQEYLAVHNIVSHVNKMWGSDKSYSLRISKKDSVGNLILLFGDKLISRKAIVYNLWKQAYDILNTIDNEIEKNNKVLEIKEKIRLIQGVGRGRKRSY